MLIPFVTADQLVAHAIGDYLLQSDWMAKRKTASGAAGDYACLAHVVTYCVPFYFLVDPSSRWALSAIMGSHFLIDRAEVVMTGYDEMTNEYGNLVEASDARRLADIRSGSRALLVGESNPYSSDPSDTLLPWPEEASGNRLKKILGMTEDEYMQKFERRNLMSRGERWSIKSAALSAEALLAEFEPRCVVALGRRVTAAIHRALNKQVPWMPPAPAPFAAVSGRRTILLSLPNPSGMCREWNRARAAEHARECVACLFEIRGW